MQWPILRLSSRGAWLAAKPTGVLADDCANLLREFFAERRGAAQKQV